MEYSYKPCGVCSRLIEFDISKEGKVSGIRFTGGCNGNLKAISKILEGQDADFIIERLTGNTCKEKPTSCADQLAHAVAEAKRALGKSGE